MRMYLSSFTGLLFPEGKGAGEEAGCFNSVWNNSARLFYKIYASFGFSYDGNDIRNSLVDSLVFVVWVSSGGRDLKEIQNWNVRQNLIFFKDAGTPNQVHPVSCLWQWSVADGDGNVRTEAAYKSSSR